jgi:hypothetical protein
MEHVITIILGGWTVLLTALLSVLGYIMNEKITKIKEIEEKLNATRVEVAREHITREEVTKITEHIDARFNRLEEKIDRLFEAKMKNA